MPTELGGVRWRHQKAAGLGCERPLCCIVAEQRPHPRPTAAAEATPAAKADS